MLLDDLPRLLRLRKVPTPQVPLPGKVIRVIEYPGSLGIPLGPWWLIRPTPAQFQLMIELDLRAAEEAARRLFSTPKTPWDLADQQDPVQLPPQFPRVWLGPVHLNERLRNGAPVSVVYEVPAPRPGFPARFVVHHVEPLGK